MSEREPNSLDKQMRRVEELVGTLEKLGNPVARATAQELMKTLLALHRDGLERMLEILRLTESGSATALAMGQDQLVGSLLLLHGLHPVDVETRVRQALEQVGPMIRGHGGDLEIVAVAQGLVRVRMIGNCSLPAEALEHALEEAFANTCPDVQVIEVEDATRKPVGQMPLPVVR
jgi:Fe-S cluster biogenesis protein NfuA